MTSPTLLPLLSVLKSTLCASMNSNICLLDFELWGLGRLISNQQQRMSSRRSTSAYADIPSSPFSKPDDEPMLSNMPETTSPKLSPIMSPQIPLNSHPPSTPIRKSPLPPPLIINTKPYASETESPPVSGAKGDESGNKDDNDNDNDESDICLSPSWSDFRGTRRKREKEKKRLGQDKKEPERQQTRDAERQRAEYIAGKRLSKKPPAAMDTQKMPSALRRNSGNSGKSFTGISFLSATRSSSPGSSRRSSRDEGSSWRLSLGSLIKRRSLPTPSTSTELPPESRANDVTLESGVGPQQRQPDSIADDSAFVGIFRPIQLQPHRDGSSYVHKQRMHQQQLSIAGYQDELAVKDANERWIGDGYQPKGLPKLPSQFTVKVLNGARPTRQTPAQPGNVEAIIPKKISLPLNGETPRPKSSLKPFKGELLAPNTSIKPVKRERVLAITLAKVNDEAVIPNQLPKLVKPEESVSKISDNPVKEEIPAPKIVDEGDGILAKAADKPAKGGGILSKAAVTKPVKEEVSRPRTSFQPLEGEELVRKPSVKRPHSTPELPTTSSKPMLSSPPVLPSLDFLPQLKHQPLTKPKRTSPLATPERVSFPASSQFPLPAAPFLKSSADSHIPFSISAPDLKLPPRSPLRGGTDSSLLVPGGNPAHRRTMALLSFGKSNTAQGPDTKPIAKLFVICCKCKFWHDLPSNLYELMSSRQKLSRRNSDEGGGPPAEGSIGGVANDATLDTAVQCPWCQHYMTNYCCAGWTTVVYLHERHH